MVFSASSQVIVISPVLPRIAEALAVKESLLGTLVTSYAVTLGLFALVAGPVSDKIGRRRILLVGTGFMAACLYLHGLADTYASLLAMRTLAGMAGGALSGAAVAYVGDYFPYDRRGWANGWVMSGIAIGQVVGIPLGTLLAEFGDYRWPFLMFAVTMTGAFLLIWRLVPQPDVQRDARRLSVRRIVADYLALCRRPVTRAAALVYFLTFLGVGLYLVYLPAWLENVLSVRGEAIAALFLFGGLAHVIAGPAAGKLSDRVGRKPLVIWSCLGLAVVMPLMTWLANSLWIAFALFAAAMALIALRVSPLQSLLTALVSSRSRGMLMSFAIAAGQVGIGIGGALAGLTYARYGYWSNTLLAIVAVLVMALMVWRGLPEPDKTAPAH